MSSSTILTSTRGFVRSSAFLASALALAAALPMSAMADFAKTNPVTGETENYTWKFVGTDTWNGTGYWQNSDGNNPTGVPGKSGEGNFEPFFFDGSTVSINAGMSVEGWDLRMGLFNGATLTMNNLQKFQDGTMWVTVDESSKLTITANKNDKYEGDALNLYSARGAGIEWTCALSNAGGTGLPFNYYLAGHGTVAFTTITAANCSHTIKRADVTLSEVASSKTVRSKTLVSFTSSTSTFLADATIKVKNADGTANRDVALSSVTPTTSTLTESGNVGDCELVQTSTGILLYYVDYAKAYKNSININFTHGGVGLTTAADVGVGEYAVPGTSWSNMAGSNGSSSSIYGVDSTGEKSLVAGASVTISGALGSYRYTGVDGNVDLRYGYIDDAAGAAYETPQVVVDGIPYYKYQLVLYFSNDTNGRPFGHLTINGTNYRWDSTEGAIVTCEGTVSDVWGSSSGTVLTEGGNYLVFPAMENPDGKLTIVGHRWSGTQRMGVAAIQIVEVKPDAGENDLVIEVSGDTEYTVAETKDDAGTVYITGNGTLTLAGEAKISADTINVGSSVALNVNADRLDATTYTGGGTVVYDGVVPPTGKGWTESAWTGTVWIKNKSGITGDGDAATGVQPNSLGNVNSKVKFSGVDGWIEAPIEYNPEIVLENAGYDYALRLTNGNSPGNNDNSNRCTIVKKLSGSGTLGCAKGSYAWPLVQIWDATGFTGSINTSNPGGNAQGHTGLVVVFCDEDTSFSDSLYNLFRGEGTYPHPRTIYVASGKTVTQASTATWTAVDGFGVDGTLIADGAIASSSGTKAISGSGTVVFAGKAPSPTGDAWWKNAAWTGTVEVKNYNFAANIELATYGNSNSKVCMNGSEAYIKVADNPNHNIGELVIGSGGFTQGGSYTTDNDVNITIPCKVTGTGTYNLASTGGANKTLFLTGDISEFAGILQVGGNNNRIVLGETSRDFVGASLVVGNGKTLNFTKSTSAITPFAGGLFIDEGGQVVLSGDGFVWSAGGITVDGIFKAAGRDKWGGGTAITLGDTGVLELTSTANVNDSSFGNYPTSADLSKVTGTGTLKYSSTAGWRAFPDQDARMPASTVAIQTELYDSLIITKTNGVTVIGSLSGSKNIRSDFGTTGGNGRILTVTQSKDTEWQGKFVVNRITKFNVVAPAEGTPGTLTLSGIQEASIPMQIDGKVNLTGTWIGATTVAGTLGGTGTITGNLTLSDGATIKVDDISHPLTVSGNLTASGTIDVYLPARTSINYGVVLVFVDGTIDISGASFIVHIGNKLANVRVSALGGKLMIPPPFRIYLK